MSSQPREPSLNQRLIMAVHAGELTKVEQLLEEKASVHFTDNKGKTALHFAVALKKDEKDPTKTVKIIDLLLKKSANIEAQTKPASGQCTPLLHAAAYSNPDAIELLLNKNANIFATDNHDRDARDFAQNATIGTPRRDETIALLKKEFKKEEFRSAIKSGDCVEMIELMGGGIGANTQLPGKIIPLHEAALHSEDALRTLLAYRANHAAQDEEGNTALHVATRSQKLDTIETLLQKRANPTTRNNDGLTPLELAKGNSEITKLFGDAAEARREETATLATSLTSALKPSSAKPDDKQPNKRAREAEAESESDNDEDNNQSPSKSAS